MLKQDYTEDKLHEEVLEADAFLQPLTQLKIKTCKDPGGPRDKLTPLRLRADDNDALRHIISKPLYPKEAFESLRRIL